MDDRNGFPSSLCEEGDGENLVCADEHNHCPRVRMENNGIMDFFPSCPREVKGSAGGVCMWARTDSPATHHYLAITTQLTSEALMW